MKLICTNTKEFKINNEIKNYLEESVFSLKKVISNSEFNVYEVLKHTEKKEIGVINNHTQLLDELENLLFPFQIKIDSDGKFIEIQKKEVLLENWFKNSENVIEKYDGSEIAKDTRNRFFDTLSSDQFEAIFIHNAPFWKLFFLNPKVDFIHKKILDYSTIWNINQLGSQKIEGKAYHKYHYNDKIEVLCDATNKVSEEIINNIENNYFLENKDKKNNYTFNYKATYDILFKKLFEKELFFEVLVSKNFNYKEKISIKKL